MKSNITEFSTTDLIKIIANMHKMHNGNNTLNFDEIMCLENIGDICTKICEETGDWNIPKVNIIEEVEATIPVTLATIKNTCGWSDFCDVTGANHYALKEWTIEDSEIFNVKISHAKELKLIR